MFQGYVRVRRRPLRSGSSLLSGFNRPLRLLLQNPCISAFLRPAALITEQRADALVGAVLQRRGQAEPGKTSGGTSRAAGFCANPGLVANRRVASHLFSQRADAWKPSFAACVHRTAAERCFLETFLRSKAFSRRSGARRTTLARSMPSRLSGQPSS